mgnify:CR=1 FL=1
MSGNSACWAFAQRGKNDKIAADQAAVDEMRKELNKIDMKGKIVIGEGELDEAPMLYINESVGTNKGDDAQFKLGLCYVNIGQIENAKKEVKNFCKVANATQLPFEDKSIDIVISITTLHNLDEKDLIKALLEIERVTRKGSFITLDAKDVIRHKLVKQIIKAYKNND